MTDDIIQQKTCTKCNKLKNLSEFSRQADGKDGINPSCKSCSNIRMAAYKKTRQGLATKIYSNQLNHSKTREHDLPNYTNSQFKDWLFLHPNFETLFNIWVDSGFDKMLVPSCDRLDDYASYTLDNIRLVTWVVNKEKGYADRKSGANNKASKSVIQSTKAGELVAEHYSAHQASRTTGIHRGNICLCCLGKAKSAGGFFWEYSH